MPAFETMDLIHDAVLWPASGQGADGDWTIGSPSDIKCRWNHGRRQSLDPQGNVISLDAQIVVAQRVDIGSILWRGTLADWNSAGSVGDQTELMRVVNYRETDDLKGRNTRRTLDVQRHRDSLPAG